MSFDTEPFSVTLPKALSVSVGVHEVCLVSFMKRDLAKIFLTGNTVVAIPAYGEWNAFHADCQAATGRNNSNPFKTHFQHVMRHIGRRYDFETAALSTVDVDRRDIDEVLIHPSLSKSLDDYWMIFGRQ